MVKNASSSLKKRGRPPEYDREVVVSTAMRAFWTKGFAATTLSDLEHATGVDRSTLYKSFDGKDGLYRSAAAAYVDIAEEHLFATLNNGSNGITDIVEFLDRLNNFYLSDDYPQGCLIVNDLASPVDHEATNRYLRNLQQGLNKALGRAAAAGETDPSKVTQRCQFLSAAVIGISIVNRSDTDNTTTLALITGIRSEVRSWLICSAEHD